MAATGTTVHVEAGDDYFAPTCVLRVTANSTVTLVVHNGGQMFHNVAVPSQRISTDVPPGKTITVHVQVGTAPVVYYCTYHQAAGMYGSLVPAT